MKLYARYKTTVAYDALFASVKFKIQIRNESEKYCFFRNTFTEYLKLDECTKLYKKLPDGGFEGWIEALVKTWVKEKIYSLQKEKDNDTARSNVIKSLNSKWTEIELVVENNKK